MSAVTTEPIVSSNHPPTQQVADLAAFDFDQRHHQARTLAETEARKLFMSEYIRRMNAPTFPHFEGAGDLLQFVIDQGVKRLMLEEETPFVLDSLNLDVYQQVAAYFTKDSSTFAHDLDFRKGLLIFGAYGCGKTQLMRLFSANPRQSFRVISSRAIAEEFRLNGDVGQYKAAFLNDSSQKHFGHRELGLCVDDLGAESERSHYGNHSNVIAELIQDRYDNHLLRGHMTHIVTNHTPAELKEAYGPRVYDRLRQMVNIIEFPETAVSRRH